MKTIAKYVRIGGIFTIRNEQETTTFTMQKGRDALCVKSTCPGVEGNFFKVRPRAIVHIESESEIIPSKLEQSRHAIAMLDEKLARIAAERATDSSPLTPDS